MRVPDRIILKSDFQRQEMLKPKFITTSTIATAAILVLFSIGILQNVVFAHQRQLFTIGDKDYLFVVGQ
jgi:hypothetical protein